MEAQPYSSIVLWVDRSSLWFLCIFPLYFSIYFHFILSQPRFEHTVGMVKSGRYTDTYPPRINLLITKFWRKTCHVRILHYYQNVMSHVGFYLYLYFIFLLCCNLIGHYMRGWFLVSPLSNSLVLFVHCTVLPIFVTIFERALY